MEFERHSEQEGSNISQLQFTPSVFKNTGSLIIILLLCFGLLVFICDLLTLVAMIKTRRVPFAAKLLICITLVCDCIFVLTSYFGFVVRRFFNVQNVVYMSIGTETGRLCIALSWVTVALMLFERVMCFYLPNEYAKHASNRNIVMGTVAVLATVAITKLTTRYVFIRLVRNKAFDFVASSKDEDILLFILGLCLFIIVSSYLAIFKVLRRHILQVYALTFSSSIIKSYTATKAIVVVFIVFVSLHLPLFCMLLWKKYSDNAVDGRFLVFIIMFIACGFNPILYAWRFKECRYIMICGLATICPMHKKRAECMRLNVYNIVVNNSNCSESRA